MYNNKQHLQWWRLYYVFIYVLYTFDTSQQTCSFSFEIVILFDDYMKQANYYEAES